MKYSLYCLYFVILCSYIQYSCTFDTSAPPKFLRLDNAKSLADLVGPSPDGDGSLEGSGIIYRKDLNQAFIVCDNLYNDVIGLYDDPSDDHYIPLFNVLSFETYEGITYENTTRNYYLVTEELKVVGTDRYKARILSFTESFALTSRNEVNFIFTSDNKGIEGLTTIVRNGTHYLLALCEGNNCEGGDAGKEFGGGTILVLQNATYLNGHGEIDGHWVVKDYLKLPYELPFQDYSGIDLRDNKYLVVISQSSSLLWIGELEDDSWTVKGGDTGGELYSFPLSANGDIEYCTMEGVSWMSPNKVIVTSDKADDDDPQICLDNAEAVFTFNIPFF